LYLANENQNIAIAHAALKSYQTVIRVVDDVVDVGLVVVKVE